MYRHVKMLYVALFMLLASPWCAHINANNLVTQASNQISTVRGVVSDDFGPVVGATVVVKGTTNGTITDLDGNFEIQNVKMNDLIEVSFMGFKSQTVKFTGQSLLKVQLKEDTQLLDEVVVVGYGTQKKINVTGSVGTVSSKELDSRPVNSVGQALQGIVPGLNLSNNNQGGALGNNMSINIRGTGSIGEGSSASPLVLIDGIEGDMNSLAPQDIENISVLKDAASSSIYGARAAFGVILITTKSGKVEKAKVSYSNSFRYSTPVSLPKMMNSGRFSQYWNRAGINSKQGAIFNDETLGLIDKQMNNSWTEEERQLGYPSGTRPAKSGGDLWEVYAKGFANTNWFDEQYLSWAPSQEHNINVSGGSDRATYSISGTLLDVKGLVRHGGDFMQRYNLNAKVGIKISDYVRLNFSSRWTRQDLSKPTYLTGLFFHNIARRWPTIAVKDHFGNYLKPTDINQLETGGRSTEQRDWLTNYAQLIIEPIKDWKIIAEGSFRTDVRYNHSEYLPVYEYDKNNQPIPFQWNDDFAAGDSRVAESSRKDNFYTINAYTEYSKQFKDHYIKGLFGFNSELMKVRDLSGRADNLITPSVPTINTATSNMRASGGYSEWASAGFFARLNYNYKERYLIELNGRYDGVSRFIGSKRWGFFPSVSLGWNLGNEDFYKNHLGKFAEALHTIKFRGSWGDLGNMNTNNWYPFYQTMPTGIENSSWIVDGVKQNTAGTPGIVSSNMTWERVRQWNIGVDLGAFNNRLTASFDYFVRNTLDMIGPAPELPSILGTSVPKVNNCDMKSYGWELEIGWRDQIKDFSYGVKLVLSDSQEKITRYPNENKNLDSYYTNMKRGNIWGFKTAGIAQSQEEMDKHLENNRPTWGTEWGAGDIMYQDLNGDGIISQGDNTLGNHGDRVIIGNTTPRYNYGIFLDAGYKGFDLSLFFQGVGKRDFMLGGPYFWGATGQGLWQAAAFNEHWDFWRPEGDPLGANTNAYYPIVNFDDGKNTKNQTRYLQDASYIRLKNIQLGYTFPKQWLQKAKINRLRVFISGDNLFTISNISGIFDPESLGGDWGQGKLYPLQKVISFGLNVNF